MNYDWMACLHSDWKGKPFACKGIDIIKLKLDRGDLKLSASDGNIIVEPPPFDYPRRERAKTFDYHMRSGTVNACSPTNTIKKAHVAICRGSLRGTIYTEGRYIVARGAINVEISSDATIIPKTKGHIIASGYRSEVITDDKDDSGFYKYIPKQKCESTHTDNEKKIYLISKTGKIIFTHLPQA